MNVIKSTVLSSKYARKDYQKLPDFDHFLVTFIKGFYGHPIFNHLLKLSVRSKNQGLQQ